MFREPDQIKSSEELLKAFRSRDQKNVFIPKTMRFPLSIGHYLAWTEPSGVRVYLVFKKADWKAPVGVAFRRESLPRPRMYPEAGEYRQSDR